METLIQQLRILQSEVFVYYTKAQGYHWNVEGILFNQFHDFFSEIYNDAWNSIDEYAEWIRTFGQYVDFDAAKSVMVSNVKYDLGNTNNPTDMLKSLLVSNDRIIEDLSSAFNMANIAGQQGVADFIAGRIATHQKFRWKMVSSLKTLINN